MAKKKMEERQTRREQEQTDKVFDVNPRHVLVPCYCKRRKRRKSRENREKREKRRKKREIRKETGKGRIAEHKKTVNKKEGGRNAQPHSTSGRREERKEREKKTSAPKRTSTKGRKKSKEEKLGEKRRGKTRKKGKG